MSPPCQSWATPTASIVAWVNHLLLWGAAREATTAPSPWSMESFPPRTSSTTSAPAAPTDSHNPQARFRSFPGTSHLSPVLSILTPAFLSWPRVWRQGWTRAWGLWVVPTAQARTCPLAAVVATQTSHQVLLPGWTKLTTVSFDNLCWLVCSH